MQWIHDNIFHTGSTSHGRICDVIINGGSFKNVASTNVVKLKMKVENHPKPYKSPLARQKGMR